MIRNIYCSIICDSPIFVFLAFIFLYIPYLNSQLKLHICIHTHIYIHTHTYFLLANASERHKNVHIQSGMQVKEPLGSFLRNSSLKWLLVFPLYKQRNQISKKLINLHKGARNSNPCLQIYQKRGENQCLAMLPATALMHLPLL